MAILVVAGCNVREVSEWAGHNRAASTPTRYGGLVEDGSDEAVDRLDALLGARADRPSSVVQLRDAEARWAPRAPSGALAPTNLWERIGPGAGERRFHMSGPKWT